MKWPKQIVRSRGAFKLRANYDEYQGTHGTIVVAYVAEICKAGTDAQTTNHYNLKQRSTGDGNLN